MQTLCVLSRRYKNGVSTFRFVQTENGELWMFGGLKPQCLQFANRKEMNEAIIGWRRLGFSYGLPTNKPVKKRVFVQQQQSELPAELRQQLAELAA